MTETTPRAGEPSARPSQDAGGSARRGRRSDTAGAVRGSRNRRTRSGGSAPSLRGSSIYWLIGILVVSAVMRIVYLQEVRQAPDFSAPEVDAGFHDYWARGLAFGDWSLPEVKADPEIRTSAYFRPPAYPYFLAAIYSVAGPGYLAPRIVQMLLGLLSVFLAYLVMRRWVGEAVGLIAAALVGSYWILIYYEGEFLEGPLMVLGILGLTYLLLGWTRWLGWKHAILAGLVCGLSALVRPNALLFLPAVAAWAWWMSRRRNDRRFLTVGIPGLALGMAVAILPVTIRNYAVSGEFVWITSNAGINLYLGNNERADGRIQGEIPGLGPFDTCFDYPPLVAKLEAKLGRNLTDGEVSDYFTDLALDYMRAHPLDVVRLLARKTLLFWGPLEVSHNKVEEAERDHSPLLSALPVRFSVAFALALLGGALLWIARSGKGGEARRSGSRSSQDADADPAQDVGSKANAGSTQGPGSTPSSRRRSAAGRSMKEMVGARWESTVLVTMLIGTWWLSFLPFFVSARYRAPIIPLLLGFSAFALYQIWVWVRAGELRRTGFALGAGIALFLLVNVNWVGYQIDRARWHYARGRGYSASQRWEDAAAEFRRTLELNPTFVSAHVDLGVLLAMRSEWNEAYEHLRQAAQLEPDNPFAQQNLAGVLEAQGRLEEARTHFEAAAELKPSWSKPRMGLQRVEQALAQRSDGAP